MTTLSCLDVRRVDESMWKLLSDFVYEGQSETFIVPRGFLTDFASVPPFMRGIIDDTGKWTLAAVVHDYLITYRINALDDLSYVSSRDVDGIFRRIMREQDVSFMTRWVMWSAVRWASLFSPGRRRGRGFLRDLPRVALASVPALVLFAPVGLLTLVLRGSLKLIKF